MLWPSFLMLDSVAARLFYIRHILIMLSFGFDCVDDANGKKMNASMGTTTQISFLSPCSSWAMKSCSSYMNTRRTLRNREDGWIIEVWVAILSALHLKTNDMLWSLDQQTVWDEIFHRHSLVNSEDAPFEYWCLFFSFAVWKCPGELRLIDGTEDKTLMQRSWGRNNSYFSFTNWCLQKFCAAFRLDDYRIVNRRSMGPKKCPASAKYIYIC